jgi:hypothetical protein
MTTQKVPALTPTPAASSPGPSGFVAPSAILSLGGWKPRSCRADASPLRP